jgi:hypothetical protein
MIVKARFDGQVLVPDEPVNLPAGQPVSVSIDPTPPAPATTAMPLLDLSDALDRLPCDASWPDDSAAQHDHYLYGAPSGQDPDRDGLLRGHARPTRCSKEKS